MEALYLYIAKSAGLVILFYCAYYFLLRKETFFTTNRWFLLTGLITSAVLPLVSYTKVIWINASPISNLNPQEIPFQPIKNEVHEINWIYVISLIYGVGFLILLIKFALDFYSLQSILKGKKIHQQADFKFIDTNENIAPFSYFEYIVYNSSMYTDTELQNIIEHEKVHSDQNHTIDVLLSRAFCLLFWFNPIIWIYKKAIVQNLEFIADKEAAKKLSDKKSYQYTLLKITTHESCVAITNHFYQSLIKKRIVMLNKNQSKKRNSWKYYVVIPALVAFVLVFQVETIAKEKQQIVQSGNGEIKSLDVYKIKKTSTDADLKEIKEKLKSIHNVDFQASEIKRNAQNQLISIKIDIKNGKQTAQSIQTSGNEAIKDFGILVTTDENGIKKIGIQTTSEQTNSSTKTTKQPKVAISNELKNKIETNADTHSSTSTKTNNNISTNISTFVTTNTNSNASTKVVTTNNGSNVTVYSSTNKTPLGSQLIIIDGEEMPAGFDIEDIDNGKVKSVSVYNGTNALAKYGDKGANGVIEIETRK